MSKLAAGLFVYCPSTQRFLIAKRGPTINDPNVWATFGGKMDEGESLIQTAEREFKEESGYNGRLNISSKPIPTENDDGFVFTTFLATVDNEFTPPMVGKETVDGEVETSNAKWVTKDVLVGMIDKEYTHKGFNRFLKKLFLNKTIKENMKKMIKESDTFKLLKTFGMWELCEYDGNKKYVIENSKTGTPYVVNFINGKLVPQQPISGLSKDVLLQMSEYLNSTIIKESKQIAMDNYIRKIVISELKRLK